ncbi:MAG: HEPN domain-containing protein [Nitrososphaerota archaeon]|nr:HEPN domain-containing protein [Nitrososphaerota archaeon]MDG6939833.1 HEPN domain-containing protein [Nitrososphaerota archaeon]
MQEVALFPLLEWFAATFMLAVLVAILYRLQGRGSGRHVDPSVATGYFVSMYDPEAERNLSYAGEMLRSDRLKESVEHSYRAAESILTTACGKLGVETSHTALAEMVKRLEAAGVMNLDTEWVDYLEKTRQYATMPLNSSLAGRAFGAASKIVLHMQHAPVKVQTGDEGRAV